MVILYRVSSSYHTRPILAIIRVRVAHGRCFAHAHNKHTRSPPYIPNDVTYSAPVVQHYTENGVTINIWCSCLPTRAGPVRTLQIPLCEPFDKLSHVQNHYYLDDAPHHSSNIFCNIYVCIKNRQGSQPPPVLGQTSHLPCTNPTYFCLANWG